MTDNIIVDLDGTLALERHRRPLIRHGWGKYFERIHLDPVNRSVLHFLDLAGPLHRVHIFTSRPEMYREQTLAWLDKHAVTYDVLEMRPEKHTNMGQGGWQDVASDADIKTAMLDRYELNRVNTLCVLEDRDEMVEFYRNLGFDCWQVHPQHEMYVPDPV